MHPPSPHTVPMVCPGLPAEAAFPAALAARLRAERIVAVVTIERHEDAVPLARALVEGGVRAIELAWRSDAALEAVRAIVDAVPEMLAGMGTLLTPEQVEAAVRAGAHFGVSPGVSQGVIRAAQRLGLPFAPGVQTASDVQVAIEHGCRLLKFFPAASAGGVPHLRNLQAPFAHLGLQYLPLGGIDEKSAAAYLAEPCVAAIGGSWIAPPALVRDRAWDVVRCRAAAARALVS